MIEDLVAQAVREVAAEIPADGVPALRLPARHARSRWVSMLAPAAAAAAVLLIAVAVALADGLRHSSGGTPPVPCAGAAGAGGCPVPAYYIALTGTAKPYPEHSYAAAIYLTATGRLIAQVPTPGGPGNSVIAVSAAADDTWMGPHGEMAGDTIDPWPLSWAADDTTLALNWYGVGPGPLPGLTSSSGLRLLDTARGGTSIVADSRLAVPFRLVNNTHATASGYLSDVLLITPDGDTAVGAMTAFSGPDGGFAEFSAVTGRLRRKVAWGPVGASAGGPMDVLWTSRTGSTLVVAAPPDRPGRLGVISRGHLTLLPRSARIALPGAAW